MKKILILSTLMASLLNAEILLYGSNAAAPAMKELAKEFEKKSGERVVVTSGHSKSWIRKARRDADLIYASNAEAMGRYIEMLPHLSVENISTVDLRQTGLLVRPNNPLKIANFNDILDKKLKVMVVNARHNDYETMALKMGNKENLSKLRKNIVVYAKNIEEALALWRQDVSIDVLIASSHLAKMLKNEALFVEAGEEFALYKATELIPTQKALQNKKVQEFIDFAQSKEGQQILQNSAWDLGGAFRQKSNRNLPPPPPPHHRNHPHQGGLTY